MNREDFSAFVSTTLEEVVRFAEEKAGQKLPRKLAFQWLGRSNPCLTENIVEAIVKRVFMDEERIYSSVDLGVADLLENGALLIIGSVSDDTLRPFGPNREGRQGPFVPIVGISFLQNDGCEGWFLTRQAFPFHYSTHGKGENTLAREA
jgi:hypothetical protein